MTDLVLIFTEASYIDDYCEKDIQCQAAFGTHSQCKTLDPKNLVGKCDCSDDAHFIDRLCYKSASKRILSSYL